ncbi:MAG: hypothetical protein ABJ327_01240 [Litoreibacter sp.]
MGDLPANTIYHSDSFFTLTLIERIGLIGVTLLLSLILVGFAFKICRGKGRLRSVLWVASLFAAFVWLSPQAYYTYYIAIFDDLPWQIVIVKPPGISDLLSLISFSGRNTLSAHGQGVLFWSMLAIGFWRSRKVT